MNDKHLKSIIKILTDWNPLGDRAEELLDETGYETEAIDILFHIGSDLQFRKLKDIETRVLIIVKELLNEAFNLFLTDGDCKEPAFAIYNVIKKS